MSPLSRGDTFRIAARNLLNQTTTTELKSRCIGVETRPNMSVRRYHYGRRTKNDQTAHHAPASRQPAFSCERVRRRVARWRTPRLRAIGELRVFCCLDYLRPVSVDLHDDRGGCRGG